MSYSMKADISASRRTKRNLPFLLASLFILIFAGMGAPPAQALTYSYTGPAFDTAQCHTHTGYSIPPCTGGSINASFTLTGIASNYSGVVHKASVSSWTMDASGIGSLNQGNYLNTSFNIDFSSGVVRSWSFQGYTASTTYTTAITSISNPGGYNSAYTGYPTPSLYGWIEPASNWGVWTNPKAYGPPQPLPQASNPAPPPPEAA